MTGPFLALIVGAACTQEDKADGGASTPPADSGAPTDSGDDSAAPTDSEDTGDSAGAPDTAPPVDTGPEDADGDGYFPPEDCDDTNPRVYPGAIDWCDGVDQDCDGDPVGAGMCSDVTNWAELETSYWAGVGDQMITVPPTAAELDGVYTQFGYARGYRDDTDTPGWNAWFALQGLPLGDDGDWLANRVGVWVNGDSSYFELRQLEGAGDFDGDGHDDVWLSVQDTRDLSYHLRLVTGPSADWPVRGQYTEDAGAGAWWDEGWPPLVLEPIAAGRDIDGDGLDDLIQVSASTDGREAGDYGRMTVILGREGALNMSASIYDEPGLHLDDYVAGGEIGPDIDGDGLREVVDVTHEGLYWVDGATFSSGDEAEFTTVASILSEGDDLHVSSPTHNPVVGDLDGDGTEDLLLAVTTADESTGGCMLWLSGGALSSATLVADASIAAVCGEGSVGAFWGGEGADIDGDGVIDVSVGDDGARYYDYYGTQVDGNVLCAIPSSALPRGGTVTPAEIGLCQYGLHHVVGDLDGDGIVELVGANRAAETDPRNGRVDFLVGAAIPWDDPSKW